MSGIVGQLFSQDGDVDVVGTVDSGGLIQPVSATNPLPVQLLTTPTIDIGDVTLLAGTALVGKVGIDQVTANANEVVLKAGAAIVGNVRIDQTTPGTTDSVTVKSRGYNSSAVFTPAAAEHVAGDVNGGAVEFAAIGPSGGRIKINSVSLTIASATVEATAWFLYLFSVTPPSAVADDAAHTLPAGDLASFLGKIALGTALDEVDNQYIETNNVGKQIKLAGTSVFGYLVNGTTLTPAAVAHTVTLHAEVV